jgi:archaellum component FlaF (FlaF/FlaG flagellin family)
MNRTLVALILTLIAASAHAEWILYGDNGKAEFYYDDKTIVTNGIYVTVWEMLNYSFPLNSELLKHGKHIFKVVYMLENIKTVEIRLENIKWR